MVIYAPRLSSVEHTNNHPTTREADSRINVWLRSFPTLIVGQTHHTNRIL